MISEGFGGWMAWDFDLEDWTGQFCGQGTYPLIRLLNDALEYVLNKCICGYNIGL